MLDARRVRRKTTGQCRRIAAALLAATVAGCGWSGSPLVPLSGTVSLDGQPLARGMIQFEPEATTGSTAVASVANGRFSATTGGRPGIAPGRYKVRIDARAEPADETDTLPRSVIAAKYADAATSGLGCEIAVGRENVVDWKLEPPR